MISDPLRKGKLPLRNISADLFASGVDNGRTRGHNVHEIDSDDTFDLISAQDSELWKNAWTKFWEFGWTLPAEEESFYGIVPIREVKGNDLARDPEIVAENLFVNANSVDGLKTYYETSTEEDKAVFLFRFAVTDYFSRAVEAYLMNGENKIKTITRKTFYAEETVFLNFDIIQLTFNSDGVYTVIPVVSNPIDIINALTPPIDMQGNWWEKILFWIAMIILIVLIILFLPLLMPIFRLVISCISGVFKMIGKFFGFLFSGFRKRR